MDEKTSERDSKLERHGLRETAQNKLALHYNERNLVKLIDLPNQLSAVEREKLAELLRQEKQSYHEVAKQRFDSSKNWSIMIKSECNDERNDIMRRFKFQQLKKHHLHEFIRKEKERIIKERINTQKPVDDD